MALKKEEKYLSLGCNIAGTIFAINCCLSKHASWLVNDESQSDILQQYVRKLCETHRKWTFKHTEDVWFFVLLIKILWVISSWNLFWIVWIICFFESKYRKNNFLGKNNYFFRYNSIIPTIAVERKWIHIFPNHMDAYVNVYSCCVPCSISIYSIVCKMWLFFSFFCQCVLNYLTHPVYIQG